MKNDNIDHPEYYANGNIEVIDFIEDKELNFNRGNAIKYIARAGKKNVSYIQGIYRNLMQRKIFTADAYWSDQYQRDNGNSG